MAARKKTARKQATRKASATGKTGAKAKPATKTASKAGGSAGASGKRRKTAKPSAPNAAPKKATKAAKSARRKTGAVGKRTSKAGAAPKAAAFPEIEALAELMEKHGLHEVSYSREADGSTSLHVSKGGAPVAYAAAPAPMMQAAPGLPAAAVADGAVAVDAAPSPAADETLHAFKSPMVGTFYRAPSPEAAPFSTTGDNVDPNSVVCIIEAMKVMNEINPDIAGEIVSIEVENGEAVEFGQTLMLLRPR